MGNIQNIKSMHNAQVSYFVHVCDCDGNIELSQQFDQSNFSRTFFI